jgi:LPS sulfotransferase NodH
MLGIPPKTVAQAVAPLRKVQTDLLNIVKAKGEAIKKSAKAINDAETIARNVKASETQAIEQSQKEADEAQRIADAFETLLLGGEPKKQEPVT